MYMNLKPNKKYNIFNTLTMVSLGFIAPPPKILAPCLKFSSPPIVSFCSGLPPIILI